MPVFLFISDNKLIKNILINQTEKSCVKLYMFYKYARKIAENPLRNQNLKVIIFVHFRSVIRLDQIRNIQRMMLVKPLIQSRHFV